MSISIIGFRYKNIRNVVVTVNIDSNFFSKLALGIIRGPFYVNKAVVQKFAKNGAVTLLQLLARE